MLSARSRLTLLLTALVLAAGVLLTVLTYVLMRQSLPRKLSVVTIIRGESAGPPPSLPRPDVEQVALRDFLTQSGVALVVVAVLAAVLAWLVAGRVLAPIRMITATARRLSAEHLSERVPVPGPRDELAALAVTVNGMLDRIEHGVAERDRVLASQRLFTANAAHELRTPLATIRTAVDVTLDGHPTRADLLAMAGDVRGAAERSARTLDGLLVLARSQAALGARCELDLAEVVSGAVAEHDPGDRIVEVDARSAPVLGEPVLVARMAGNLVDNAVRHNEPGGQVAVATGVAGGWSYLTVVNQGPRVSDVDALLVPFARGGESRTRNESRNEPRTEGLGLGLSIVRAVVVAHDGELTVTPREEGGLTVTVRLPTAPHS